VIARGELRDHSAVGFMHRHLRVQVVGEQSLVSIVDGEPGLVAGSFDAQHPHDSPIHIRKWREYSSLAHCTVGCYTYQLS
jgi:hypothetical protein